MRLALVLLFIVILVCSITTAAQPRAGGAIVAVDEASEGAGGGKVTPVKTTTKTNKTNRTAANSTHKTPSRTTITTPRPYSGPVIGDTFSFLNNEVIEPVQPIYTTAAKRAGAKGLVQVAILVETDGRVLQAKARSGNQLLWPEAERAALGTRLDRPTDSSGRPVRALGFLVYRFGPESIDD